MIDYVNRSSDGPNLGSSERGVRNIGIPIPKKKWVGTTPAGFEPALANEVDDQEEWFESTALTTRPKCR